jgi:hypothetical protein
MRMLSGAVLLVGAEQAFAHALLVRFPHEVFARDVLFPVSGVLLVVGLTLLVWGIATERKSS